VTTDVLVVIGSGAIGQAIARRTGVGKLILLADTNTDSLTATADLMETSGYNVRTQPVDVSSRESVRALAAAAAELGPVTGSCTRPASHRRRHWWMRSSKWT
jgi:NAD(P)-dependent dehydrogenase (short-subunit alcohol dehydrogenase family)